jgi:hypothetical protein
MQKLFIFLVNMFYLFFATSGMGIFLGERFVLSLPIICLILMDVILILMLITNLSKVRVKPFIFTSFLVVWSVLVSATRYDISTFILTLLGFILMLIPLIIKIPVPDKVTLSKFYCQGLLLSFIISYFEFFLALFFKLQFVNILPFIAHKSVGDLSNSLNISLNRISSLMTEPSEYSFFLVFGYISLDYLLYKGSIKRSTSIFMKFNIVLFLILTFSISGFILFGLYLVLSNAFLSFQKNGTKTLLGNTLSFFAVIILIVILIKSVPEIEIAFSSFTNRTFSFLQMNDVDNLNTSEGSRSSSIKIAVDSLNSSYGFVGQGFGKNLSDWIASEYSNSLFGRTGRGEIYNTYAAITIGLGIPGLLAFIGIIYQSFKTTKSDNSYQKIFFLVWLALGFFIGSLVYYSYWGIFYLVATEEISTVHLKYKGITLNKD